MKKYYINLTEQERSQIIHSLIDKKNALVAQGRYTDAVDEVILKLMKAKKEAFIRILLESKEYVEFLVGRNGEFDQLVSSTVRRVKRNYRDDNSALVLVLPYLSAEYEKNEEAFQEYYDEVEICQSSSAAHFKAAMQVRNREMVDRADLVLCCIERKSGGAYQTVLYAKKQNKQIINLAGGMTTFCE